MTASRRWSGSAFGRWRFPGKGVVGRQKNDGRAGKHGKERTDMKYFVKTSAAVVLLTLSIAGFGLFPVRAESTGLGNNLVTECSMENGAASEEDVTDSKSDAADAAGTDDNRESGSDAAGTDTEDVEPGDVSMDGSRENSGTVSGGECAAAPDGCAEPDDSEGRQEAGAAEAEDGASTDTVTGADNTSLEDELKESGEAGCLPDFPGWKSTRCPQA